MGEEKIRGEQCVICVVYTREVRDAHFVIDVRDMCVCVCVCV